MSPRTRTTSDFRCQKVWYYKKGIFKTPLLRSLRLDWKFVLFSLTVCVFWFDSFDSDILGFGFLLKRVDWLQPSMSVVKLCCTIRNHEKSHQSIPRLDQWPRAWTFARMGAKKEGNSVAYLCKTELVEQGKLWLQNLMLFAIFLSYDQESRHTLLLYESCVLSTI